MTWSRFIGRLQVCVLMVGACSSSTVAPPGGGGATGTAGTPGTAGAAGREGMGGAAGTTPGCPEGLLSQEPSIDPAPELTAAAGASCGALSVDVIVSGVTGREQQKMQQVYNVQVTAEGATSGPDSFLLPGFPHSAGYVYRTASGGQIVLADFVYGTASQEGRVTFKVRLADGLLNVLASGSGDGTIQPGSTTRMSVTVDPVDAW